MYLPVAGTNHIMMMSRRIASSSQQNSDILAGLFDDITAGRVLEDMKLGVDGDVAAFWGVKRHPEDFFVPSTDSESGIPRKKRRILPPLSTLSVQSRASTQNLAELSFPPLQDVLKTTRGNHPSRFVHPFSPDALPIPHITPRRRRVSLRSSPTSGSSAASSSSEMMTGGFPCPHFIPPETMIMDNEGSQNVVKKSYHHGQNPSLGGPSDASFGWFVDLDHHHQEDDSSRAAKLYQHQVNFSPPNQFHSIDFLAYQAPVASNIRTDEDAELEWAMAVDTIDSIFGGAGDEVIDGKE
jgi:hypothetical protein